MGYEKSDGNEFENILPQKYYKKFETSEENSEWDLNCFRNPI